MSKLTDRQKKQIVAEYVAGDGSISQQKLADKYHVSRQAISKILSCEKSREMLRQKKEENTLSMLAYLDSRKDTAQSLIDRILASSAADIEKASLRDKIGALKILSDVFCKTSESTSATDDKRHITVEFVESAKDEH